MELGPLPGLAIAKAAAIRLDINAADRQSHTTSVGLCDVERVEDFLHLVSAYSDKQKFCSKLELQPVLHDARIHAHRTYLSEGVRARNITGRIGKVRMIENVEDFPAENHLGLIPKLCALDECHVDVALVRSSKNIPS